jgi:hypothetical protein
MSKNLATDVATLLVAPLFLSLAVPASAGVAEECASSAEQAQSLREQHRLVAATEKLRLCNREQCPRVVRGFCARWLTEVEAATPSLVVRARDARGRDVVGARVVLDGKVLQESLEGNAVLVDPGAHHVRYEAKGGDVREEDLLVAEGEKNRIVTASFGSELKPDGTAERAAALQPSPTPERQTTAEPSRGPGHGVAYVLGGLGLAALGAAGYFEISGWAKYNDLHDGCGRTRTCSASDVDGVRTRFIAAGVFLGVGVVGVGVAAWLLLNPSPRHDAHAPVGRIELAPLPGGAAVGFRREL